MTSRIAWLLLGLLIVGPAAGQDAEPLRYLGPYLDESSFMLGWVDVANVDLEQPFARLRKLGVDKQELAESQAATQKTKEQLLAAGAKRIYFTAVGSPLQFELLVVAPSSNPVKVVEALGPIPGVKAQVAGDVVLVGTPRALEIAAKQRGKAGLEWTKTLDRLKGYPSYVVLLPPRGVTRALVELKPTLPAEVGGGPTASVVEAVQWAAIGVDLSKDVKLQLTIQGVDEAAVKRIVPVLDRLIAAAKSRQDVRELAVLAKLLEEHRPKQVGDQLQLVLDEAAVDSALVPLAASARGHAKVAQSTNQLKQLGIAMHNYLSTHKTFPPQATAGKDKKPLLSWRVEILPYLEEQALYDAFHRDEPWDSTHNKALIAKMPEIFRSAASSLPRTDGRTTFVVPAGPKAFFNGISKKGIGLIPDGTANTLMILDVDDSKSVVWTKPEDYDVEPKKHYVGHFRPNVGVILSVFFDGSVRRLPTKTNDELLWLYFCPNDGQALPIDD
jgi:hypothetical protein